MSAPGTSAPGVVAPAADPAWDRRSGVRIHLERLGETYGDAIRRGLEHTGLGARIRPGDTVFLKPNLTFPQFRPGVMTTPECVEALVLALLDYTPNVIVGEADSGGYNPFSMDEVFRSTGLDAIARRTGTRLVNLTREPSRDLRFVERGHELSVPLPVLLLDEVDHVLTVPVPKVHANTGVSMSIKNQWGCIQAPSMRLRLHPFFARVVFEVNRALRVAGSVIDGRFGLNRNGPMRGDVERLDWLLVADDILAADQLCCELMRIDPRRIAYLRAFARWHELPPRAEWALSADPRSFAGPRFHLKRDWLDYPGYFAFRSPRLAYLAYHSPLSAALHRLLYLFREKFYEHP
jgi:uncharacterized protein (DUF362 family)